MTQSENSKLQRWKTLLKRWGTSILQLLRLGYTSVVENDSSNYSETEPIEGTPFRVIKDEKGWFITMGEYLIHEHVKTKKEAVSLIDYKDWELVHNMVAAMVQHHSKIAAQNLQKEAERLLEEAKKQ